MRLEYAPPNILRLQKHVFQVVLVVRVARNGQLVRLLAWSVLLRVISATWDDCDGNSLRLLLIHTGHHDLCFNYILVRLCTIRSLL